MSMRTARKNKVKLLYSLQGQLVPNYLKDDQGNIVYETIDGTQVPVETGESEVGYQTPVEFFGNISYYTGWSYPAVWGITLNTGDAILLMDKDEIPIDKTSRIWHESEPVYLDDKKTIVDPDSADFTVSRVLPSLNSVRYVLKGIER